MVASTGRPRRAHRLRPRSVAITTAIGVVLTLEVILIWPYVARAGASFTRIRPGWLVVAVLAEIGSMVSFGRLQRVMLRAGGLRVRLRDAVGTALAGNAITATLPGGSIASFAYTLRRMRSWGATGTLATFALTATGIISAAAFAVLAAVAGALASNGSHLVVVGVLLTVGILLAAGILLAHPQRLTPLASATARVWTRIHPRSAAKFTPKLQNAVDELATIHPPAGAWVRGLALATVNWFDDLLCLAAACYAVGINPSPGTLLLAYAAGMAAASWLSIVPGGLGAVEAAMVLTLVHGGHGAGAATAAVLLYRLISFVLVVLAGWLLMAARARRAHRAADDGFSLSSTGYV